MTPPPHPPLVEGRDYTVDHQGRYIFTAAYLQARGHCCTSGCQNCPYGPADRPPSIDGPKGQR